MLCEERTGFIFRFSKMNNYRQMSECIERCMEIENFVQFCYISIIKCYNKCAVEWGKSLFFVYS